MLTTPAQRAEWAKLDKEATPGEWGTRPCSGGGLVVLRGEPLGCHAHPQSHLQIFPAKDGELTAAYRSAVPALCKDVEQLDAQISAAVFAGVSVGWNEETREAKAVNTLADPLAIAEAQVERLTGVLRRVHDSPHEADKWEKEVRDVLGLPMKTCHERKAELDAKRDAEGQVERLTALLREAVDHMYVGFCCELCREALGTPHKPDCVVGRIEKELHD